MSPLMALSGHTETISYLSAFGQQRTYILAGVPVSDFDQGIGAAARFLDRERHVVDGRAARRAALIAAVVGVTVHHRAHLEAVDRS